MKVEFHGLDGNGLGKISFGLQLGYCHCSFWARSCFTTLYYSIVPSLYLLKGTPLFPQSSSLWFVPFAYVISAMYSYSLAEFLWSVSRILRSSIRDRSQSSDEDVSERYQEEILEFGSSSPMFTIITTLAGLNFFCFLGVVVKKLAMDAAGILRYFDTMALQILLCAVIVLINWPLYQGLFFRKDNGKMPSSLTLQSIAFALLASTCFVYLQ
ncbi:hypothetical protein ACOSQ4_030479 [Xanthoceras sorbifolium]